MDRHITVMVLAMLLLAACGSLPQREVATRDTPASVEDRQVGGGYLAGDGPGADAPANIDAITDAVPVSEPLHKYANRPYVALGKNYMPLTVAGNFKERGVASWYGKKFHGQRTSSGETYDMFAMTAAHPTLPIPSYARVTNQANGKSVVVRVNDRGPFLHERVIDLSYTAAHKLGFIAIGSAEVEVESLAPDAGIAASLVKSEPVQSRPLEPAAMQAASSALDGQNPVAGDSNIYLQLGAFKSQEAAEVFKEKMRTELADIGKHIYVYSRDGLARVHLGPYASQEEARGSAESLSDRLGFKPMVNLRK